MEPIYKADIIKVKGDKRFGYEDTLIREVKLEIIVNSKKIGALMATPVDQEALAVGYLISENIIKDIDDIKDIKLKNDGTVVEIVSKVNEKGIKRLDSEGVVISGCGKGVTNQIDPNEIEAKIIDSDMKVEASLLTSQMSRFYKECPLYEQTGCVHTAKLFFDKDTFFIGEDIAQHNTIDKAVGKALLSGLTPKDAFLMVSGRLSSEMVAKAVMHSIPILASRTATTCLGYKIAEKFDLTLLGFVRGESFNIYTGSKRII